MVELREIAAQTPTLSLGASVARDDATLNSNILSLLSNV